MTPRLQELLKAYGIQGKDFDEIAAEVDVIFETAYELGKDDEHNEYYKS